MDKFTILKRKTKKNFFIFIIVLVIGIAMSSSLSYYIGSLESQKKVLLRETLSVDSKTQKLRNKIEKAVTSKELYEQLISTNKKLTLNRQNAVQILSKLREKHHLGTVSLTMSPVKDMRHKKFRKDNTVIEYSTITLSFKGITDEFIFAFVDSLSTEFKGYVRIKEFNLTKIGEVDKKALLSLSKGEKPMLVKGRITFDWMGIKYD